MKITGTMEIDAGVLWSELDAADRDELARNIPVSEVLDTMNNENLEQVYLEVRERLGKPDAAAFVEQLFNHYRYVDQAASIPPFVSQFLFDVLGKVPR